MKFRPVPLREAAAIAGLAESTLQTYTANPSRSTLVRGEDFYVHRRGFRRQTYFTARGMQRLIARAYSTDRDLNMPAQRIALERFKRGDVAGPRRYHGYSGCEARQRVRQRL